jgi:hypothetical protein
VTSGVQRDGMLLKVQARAICAAAAAAAAAAAWWCQPHLCTSVNCICTCKLHVYRCLPTPARPPTGAHPSLLLCCLSGFQCTLRLDMVDQVLLRGWLVPGAHAGCVLCTPGSAAAAAAGVGLRLLGVLWVMGSGCCCCCCCFCGWC